MVITLNRFIERISHEIAKIVILAHSIVLLKNNGVVVEDLHPLHAIASVTGQNACLASNKAKETSSLGAAKVQCLQKSVWIGKRHVQL